MKTNIVIDISPPYPAKFWVSSNEPKCCQPIKFQDSLNCIYYLKKEVNDKFIFCLQINTNFFFKMTVSLLEVVVQRCSLKNLFLEIWQNSQENTCARFSFLIKLQAYITTLLKERLCHRCFPVNFVKFLRTHFA